MQLRQREDARPSVKLMSYYPICSHNKGRTLDLLSSSSFELGHEEVHLSTLRHHSRWKVCIPDQRHHTIRMPPNLPHSRTAPWSQLRRQNTKTNLAQSMTDFTILIYPPFLGDGQMTKNVQNLYMNIENKFLIPPVFASFGGGYFPLCPYWGDIGPFCYP